ncbi:MAG: c-type cytochrome [Acidobacteriota bacterium]
MSTGWLTAVMLLVTSPLLGSDMSGLELGRRLYHEGLGVDGRPVIATLVSPGAAGDGVPVPGTAMTCARCHGADGRGLPEGGVTPSNLTWRSLTRPYQVTHPSGRRHGPYDPDALRRAVTEGVDPAGNPLHVAMPRFELTDTDLDALQAYLVHLGPAAEPGVHRDRIILAAWIPATASQASELRSSIEHWAADVNDRGGLYRRQVELRFVTAPDFAQAIDPGEVFAVLAPVTDPALVDWGRSVGLPVVMAAEGSDGLVRRTGRALSRLRSNLEQAGRRLTRATLLAPP